MSRNGPGVRIPHSPQKKYFKKVINFQFFVIFNTEFFEKTTYRFNEYRFTPQLILDIFNWHIIYYENLVLLKYISFFYNIAG